MTSLAGNNLGAGSTGAAGRKPVPAPAGAAPALMTTQSAVVVALLGAAVVWAFWGFFYRQHMISSSGLDWQHAYLVPVISGYLVWQNRRQIAATQPRVFWPGLIPLAMSIPCYVLFQ